LRGVDKVKKILKENLGSGSVAATRPGGKGAAGSKWASNRESCALPVGAFFTVA
jgi:hypothetical protein